MKPKVLILLGLVALVGGACGGNPRPPGPIPTPTPTPTPPPQSQMALKVQGNRLVKLDGTDPKLLGSIAGSLQDEPGWPLVSLLVLDELQAAGLNWTHVRTGPFTREGESEAYEFYQRDPASGKYDLTKVNSAFLSLLRSTCSAARARGIYCEVDLVDRWVRQHGREGLAPGGFTDQLGNALVRHPAKKQLRVDKAGFLARTPLLVQASKLDPWNAANNVQGEEWGGLGIFQAPPTPVQVGFIRAIAGAVCDLDNVTLSTGNEAFKSDSQVWEAAVVQLLREVCPGRPIGINSAFSSAGDFTIVHQSSAPPAVAVPLEVNEFGDEISPDEMINQALAADRSGVYFMYWKGDHTPDQWKKTLKSLGEIRKGNPPPPVSCLPPPEDGRWSVRCKARADVAGTDPLCASLGIGDTKSGILATAETATSQNNPALFSGSCLKVLNEANLISGMDAIIAELRKAGECAGRKSDSIFLLRNDGEWQEEHPLAWRTGCFTSISQAWKYLWHHPDAPQASCPVSPIPAGYFVDLVISKIGGNPQQYTATPKFCGAPLRSDLFPVCGTRCCTLGVDGQSQAAIVCEQVLSGIPSWQAEGLNIVTPLDGNPYNCKIASVIPPATSGTLKACGISGCSNVVTYP